ncbi:flagellar biosynthesis protein FliR [bacterium BMS3Abin04]|nr:flagellar biosynthesis protein FliR [bacterium BMS3Abin04]
MTNILISDFLGGIMIFLRIGAMFFTAPIFNNRNIPVLPKLAFAVLITYILVFSVNLGPVKYTDSLIPLAFIGIKEMITGLLMGLALRFVFIGISFAAMNIGRDMGLSMIEMFDPSLSSQNNLLSVLLMSLAIIVFILINGHHFIIESLVYSFKVIPIGHYVINGSVYTLIVKYSALIFILSIKIAAPIMVAFFLIHLASGIIARVSPNFQVFFVLLPLKLILGIFMLMVLVPIYVYVFKNLLMNYEDKLLEIIKMMSA